MSDTKKNVTFQDKNGFNRTENYTTTIPNYVNQNTDISPSKLKKQNSQKYFTTTSFNNQIPQMGQFATYQVQQGCVGAQPLCMNIIVVSKEDIEAPWRLECQYLQSVIQEMEKGSKNYGNEKVIEKIVKDDSQIIKLQQELYELKQQNQYEIKNLKLLHEQQIQKITYQQQEQQFYLKSSQAQNYETKEKEFYQLRIKLEDEINRLQKDKDIIEKQKNQIEREKVQIEKERSDLKLQFIKLNQDYSTLQVTLINYEEQIKKISLKTSQIDVNKIKDLESQVITLEQENRRLEIIFDDLNSENKLLKSKLNSYGSDMSKNNELILKIREYESRIALLNGECDRLDQVIKLKDEEIQQWRNQYQQIEESGWNVNQEKVNYLSQEVEVWKQKYIKANHEANKYLEEITMLQTELEVLKKQKKSEGALTSRVFTQQSNYSSAQKP